MSAATYVPVPATTYATKALATAGASGQQAMLVLVTADESKDGGQQLYIWTGTAFRWIAVVDDQ